MSTLNIPQSIDALYTGQVIAYPTESVWGLGCDPFDPHAVDRLLSLKNRPVDKGMILVVADRQQLAELIPSLSTTQLDTVAEPQPPTTYLLPFANGEIPQWISGEHHKVAVRVSKHPTVRALCHAFGGALVSTSANPAGCQPAREIFQLKRYFSDTVPICQGRIGASLRPSRIIDLETSRIIRG